MLRQMFEYSAFLTFAANAILHFVVLLQVTDLTVADTWPAHLMAMVLFMIMMLRLVAAFCGQASSLSRMDQRSLHAYARDIESSAEQQTFWSRMFGTTPPWVGVAILVLVIYGFGTFLYDGLQRPWSTSLREGEMWYYDEYDGWIRPVTAADASQDKLDELRAATSLSALFVFIAWANFRFAQRQRLNK